MARPPEALSYFLKFRSEFPENPTQKPAATPEGAIQDIVNFCKKGLCDASGKPIKIGGTEITGGIEWLIGEGVKKANFFTAITPKSPRIPMLFCLLPENGSSNWTRLPAFMLFVETNPVTLDPDNITLTSQTELDKIFKDRVTKIELIPLPRKLALLAALRGEGDLAKTLEWIDEANRAEGIPEISSFF
jgi:hypothetical protein